MMLADKLKVGEAIKGVIKETLHTELPYVLVKNLTKLHPASLPIGIAEKIIERCVDLGVTETTQYKRWASELNRVIAKTMSNLTESLIPKESVEEEYAELRSFEKEEIEYDIKGLRCIDEHDIGRSGVQISNAYGIFRRG